MANKVPWYQVFLLSSRGLGVLRDIAILAVFGSTSMTDSAFFLLSFSDLMMAILMGGGASLYISLQLNEKNYGSKKSVFFSATFFYIFIAILILILEYFSGFFIGNLIYPSMESSEELKEAYFLALLSIIVSFPLAVNYGYYLNANRLYLQPALNVLYLSILILSVGAWYFYNSISLMLMSLAIVFSSLVRYFFALLFTFQIARVEKFSLILDWKFYTKLFNSGLSVGFLLLFPYLFRGELTRFVDGLYAYSSVAFKFGDIFFALLVIPYILNKYKDELLDVGKVTNTIALLTLILIAVLGLISFVKADISLVDDLRYAGVILSLLTYAFFPSCYFVSMLLIRQGLEAWSLLLSALSVVVLISLKGQVNEIGSYFMTFYNLLSLYFLIGSLILLRVITREK